MPAKKGASTETCVDRHHRLCRELRDGIVRDPESALFLMLLDDPPPVLSCTPYLHDVSWAGGAYDLLFTDGFGIWCAVEVKAEPRIEGSGNHRRNRRNKARERLRKLERQTERAHSMCHLVKEGVIRALGLWYDGCWRVVAMLGL